MHVLHVSTHYACKCAHTGKAVFLPVQYIFSLMSFSCVCNCRNQLDVRIRTKETRQPRRLKTSIKCGSPGEKRLLCHLLGYRNRTRMQTRGRLCTDIIRQMRSSNTSTTLLFSPWSTVEPQMGQSCVTEEARIHLCPRSFTCTHWRIQSKAFMHLHNMCIYI